MITTLTHAAIVERAIGTIKAMLYKRLEHDDSRPCYGDMLNQVIFVYNFGRIHSTIEMTPNDARKEENADKVRLNLNKHAVHNRKYPEIKLGDMVRVYNKKKTLDKQQKSIWTKQKYKVENILYDKGITFYKNNL